MNRTLIDATLEFLPGQRSAVLDNHDQNGEWFGCSRVDSPLKSYSLAPGAGSKVEQDRAVIYEIAYTNAAFNAETHGATLNTFRWVN